MKTLWMRKRRKERETDRQIEGRNNTSVSASH